MTILRLTLPACLIAVAATSAIPARADQIVTGNYSGPYSDVIVEIRTADVGASTNRCETNGTGSGCSVSDPQTFVPKDIGNMLCLPKSIGAYSIDGACSSLLTTGQDQKCQSNSVHSNCGQSVSDYSYVAPACNWRTSSSVGTSANWQWSLSTGASGTIIKCSQTGYVNYSQ
jgi:hypothetical protein